MTELLKLIPVAALATAGVKGKDNISAQFQKIIGVTEVAVTQHELNDLAKMIYLDAIGETRILPEQLVEYCRKNLLTKPGQERDTSLDRWGTTYRLTYSGKSFKVQSAGPDKVFDSSDDIISGYRL